MKTGKLRKRDAGRVFQARKILTGVVPDAVFYVNEIGRLRHAVEKFPFG